MDRYPQSMKGFLSLIKKKSHCIPLLKLFIMDQVTYSWEMKILQLQSTDAMVNVVRRLQSQHQYAAFIRFQCAHYPATSGPCTGYLFPDLKREDCTGLYWESLR